MDLTRRSYLALGAATLAGAAACRSASSEPAPLAPTGPGLFPDMQNFDLGDTIYLNAGSQFPALRQARASVDAYMDHKETFADDGYRLNSDGPIEKFAKLVNADPDEISYVQSTTTGEMMVIRSLGLPHAGRRVVTDTLHFFALVNLLSL